MGETQNTGWDREESIQRGQLLVSRIRGGNVNLMGELRGIADIDVPIYESRRRRKRDGGGPHGFRKGDGSHARQKPAERGKGSRGNVEKPACWPRKNSPRGKTSQANKGGANPEDRVRIHVGKTSRTNKYSARKQGVASEKPSRCHSTNHKNRPRREDAGSGAEEGSGVTNICSLNFTMPSNKSSAPESYYLPRFL